jgi:23S rRNA (cytidine2498-2'-O)-methyltransferase
MARRSARGAAPPKKRQSPWVFTTRAGFEEDLLLELSRSGRDLGAWIDGPALVGTAARPSSWPVFARAGFPVGHTLSADEPQAIAEAVGEAVGALCRRGPRPWVLEVWVPDTDRANRLLPFAETLEGELVAALDELYPDLAEQRLEGPEDSIRRGGVIGQVCVAAKDRLLAGAIPGNESPTIAPGGRARERMPKGSPSRAARKLVEAFDWIGRAPEAGESVVDLGAAPGGWTTVLLGRRCRVTAVDPGRLAPQVVASGKRALRHEVMSAFEFEPDEPVDWVFCDMAWRPLEVAELLAKWARRRWAGAMLANIKLPMKRRVEFVERVLGVLADGGWRDLRARQLYHDRFEVTVSGWRV